jgi:SHS2 domain-containing protein
VFEWVDHTAELELRIDAAGEADVFVEAAAALAELLEEPETGSASQELVRREVVLEAPDRARLLADWLEELVFLAETEELVPQQVREIQVSEHRLRAVLEARIGRPRHLVKAVTYHRLAFEPRDGGWRATVVLDV